MPVFERDQFGARGVIQHRNLMLMAHVAGLAATGWMVWNLSVLPRLDREPFAGIAEQALKYTLLTCGASAAIAIGLYLVTSRSAHLEALRLAIRTSSTAVWFAPATILLSALSPLAVSAALVLVISATRLLYSEWRQLHPNNSSARVLPVGRLLFDFSPPALRFRDVAPGFTASAALQGVAVAVPLGYPLLAAALFCLSLSMVTLSLLIASSRTVQSQKSLPKSIFGLLLTIILSTGMSVGGAAGFFDQDTSGWRFNARHQRGFIASARTVARRLFYGIPREAAPRHLATKIYLPIAGGVEITDKSFPGVVLLTDAQPRTVLVAPSPSRLSELPAAPAKPSEIPFSGQYWMYRPPYSTPPATSHFEHGNPLSLSFRTTDGASMSMEAHQKLPHAIDLGCCRAIQVAISNADRYIGTVDMELILIDTSGSSLSLGKVHVESRPQGGRWVPFVAGSEILEFPVPRHSTLRQFDALKVIFHRARLRSERSAKISIDRFILLGPA